MTEQSKITADDILHFLKQESYHSCECPSCDRIRFFIEKISAAQSNKNLYNSI